MIDPFSELLVNQARNKLQGVVEADETFVGGPAEGLSGRGVTAAESKTLVLGAVEVLRWRDEEGCWQERAGRLRLAPAMRANEQSIGQFLAKNVEAGTTIKTDGWRGYSQTALASAALRTSFSSSNILPLMGLGASSDWGSLFLDVSIMTESYIQSLFAERIGGRQYGKSHAIYKFEKIKRAKRAAIAAHPGAEIIDMGVGEPDEMAFPEVVEKLCEEAHKPENRGYADNGDAILKESAVRYLDRVCGVKNIDPNTEVLHSIGSKAALSILPAVLINPGDYVLMTTPGYPVFGTHAKYFGGLVHQLPLTEKNQFLPELDSVPSEVLKKAKVLVLNYPNNPTGASATPEFFVEVVAFARQNHLVVIHDAAYAALVFEGKPLSFLATPGAKEVGLELHSSSKTFNMTGWRCGFVAGNELLIKAYGDVKDNTDSGQFLAIQHAAAHGFDHPEITEKIAAKYSRRMDALVAVLTKAGFSARKPKGSFFLYVKAPRAAIKPDGARTEFHGAEDVSQWLITEKLISSVPWDEAGAYLRFSVTFVAKNQADEARLIAEIARRLSDVRFEF